MIPTVDSVLMISSPFVPPDPGGTDPSISLVWADNSGKEDRTCESSSCPFTVNATITNPSGVAVTSKIQSSIDGSMWTDVSNLQTYSDTITDKTKWYRAVVLTSTSAYYSNVLKYEKQTVAPNITISNIVSSNGLTTYDLTVTGTPFVGYANTVAAKRVNLKNLTANYSPFGLNLNLSAAVPQGVDVFRSVAVTIPPGIYQCQIELIGVAINTDASVEGNSAISYGLSSDFYDEICETSCIYLG